MIPNDWLLHKFKMKSHFRRLCAFLHRQRALGQHDALPLDPDFWALKLVKLDG